MFHRARTLYPAVCPLTADNYSMWLLPEWFLDMSYNWYPYCLHILHNAEAPLCVFASSTCICKMSMHPRLFLWKLEINPMKPNRLSLQIVVRFIYVFMFKNVLHCRACQKCYFIHPMRHCMAKWSFVDVRFPVIAENFDQIIELHF